MQSLSYCSRHLIQHCSYRQRGASSLVKLPLLRSDFGAVLDDMELPPRPPDDRLVNSYPDLGGPLFHQLKRFGQIDNMLHDGTEILLEFKVRKIEIRFESSLGSGRADRKENRSEDLLMMIQNDSTLTNWAEKCALKDEQIFHTRLGVTIGHIDFDSGLDNIELSYDRSTVFLPSLFLESKKGQSILYNIISMKVTISRIALLWMRPSSIPDSKCLASTQNLRLTGPTNSVSTETDTKSCGVRFLTSLTY